MPTALAGRPTVSAQAAQAWAVAKGAPADRVEVAVVDYWSLAPQVGVRPEVAFAQAMLETGWLRWPGNSSPWNMAGIKTPSASGDRPDDHEQFQTPDVGIRAHLAHLCAYAHRPAPAGWTAPRTRANAGLYASWPAVTTVEELGGRWAPSPGYGARVAGLVAELVGSEQEDSMQFVTRAEWGARPPRQRTAMPLPQRNVWVHHGTGPSGPDPAALVRSYQAYHMDSRGYSDIAYNWLVDSGGRIYEGRGWGVKGGHTLGHNSSSHAVCYVGDSDQGLTDAAVGSIAAVIREGVRVGAVSGDPHIGGHRDAPGNSTSCPGDALERRLPDIRALVAGQPAGEDDEMSVEDRQVIGQWMQEVEARTAQRIRDSELRQNETIIKAVNAAVERIVAACRPSG